MMTRFIFYPMKSLFASILIALSPLGLSAFDASSADDGLYAVFTVSGGVSGEFTLRLNYEEVPLTVASFVGLAEGSIPWLDFNTGAVMHNTPYYDGIIFHRVAQGVVIQAGSPNGQGSDSPGYAFPDEINADLMHDTAGVVSMANSGLNTNGSQFFITLKDTHGLDGKHAVFGEVAEGMDIVNAIGAVDVTPRSPLDPTDGKPIVEIVIEMVDIVRVGALAQAFDATAWQVPVVQNAEPTLEYDAANKLLLLSFDRIQTGDYHFFGAISFENWIYFDDVPKTYAAPGPITFNMTADLEAYGFVMYRIAEVASPPWNDMTGAALAVDLDGMDAFEVQFDSVGEGAYMVEGSEPVSVYYQWYEVGELVQLLVYEQDTPYTLSPLQIYFNLNDGHSGTAFSRVLSSYVGSVDDPGYTADHNATGAFTFTPALPVSVQ